MKYKAGRLTQIPLFRVLWDYSHTDSFQSNNNYENSNNSGFYYDLKWSRIGWPLKTGALFDPF